MRALALLIGLVALAAAPHPALAQSDPCAGGLDPARIIECLRPGGITGTTRGIRPSTPPAGAPARPVATPGPVAAVAPPESSVDLSVQFGFDSAALTPQGTAALAALATALRDPSLAQARFRIAGHTDARGTDAYNQALSERRAEAARRYLVEQGGVDPARLSAIGYGRRQLYDVAHPDSAANRRVQVIRVDN
ncbi:MAG: OmpA family protein [Acetobacteraceae bacterium]|nr:OmpA family protein [Acetobacteraceae bacterium]